uniref:LIM zinc-binding domain-containing protein n=1 Tax=Ciona savignyi TaxID=51511 RepID=H2YZI4_CIOSA
MSVKLKQSASSPECSKCMVSLMGRQYLMQGTRKFCVECYESLYCNTCQGCKKIISAESRDISYKELHFHDTCFTCTGCDKSLANESFIHKEGQFICAKCYEDKFSPKCTTCKKAFKPGIKRMEYQGKSYHEKCFCCSACGDAIGQKSFVKREDGIFCKKCFETKLANKCGKCNKIIKTSGVAYKDQTFHESCFLCEGCGKKMAHEQFVTHEEAPYCVDCHVDKFSKKCHKCSKAISGFGESKMIVFEDCTWHVECFVCKMCNSPLEGEGFIMHEGDTYCTECEV